MVWSMTRATQLAQLGLVEIWKKNPEKYLDEACNSSSFYMEVDRVSQERILKWRHDYYFQVQCQLYCTDKNCCDFVVCTRKDIHIESVYRDRKWWGNKLVTLRKFYWSITPGTSIASDSGREALESHRIHNMQFIIHYLSLKITQILFKHLQYQSCYYFAFKYIL